jgi:two-component system, OmpR family, sensor histidine kinase CiaH
MAAGEAPDPYGTRRRLRAPVMNEAVTRTRRRLVALDLAMIALLLLMAGVAAYAVFAATLLDPVDAALTASAAELQRGGSREIAEHFGVGYRGGQFVLVVSSDGGIVADPQAVGLTDGAPLRATGLHTVHLPSGDARVLAAPMVVDPPATLIVGTSLAAQDEALRRMLLVSVATGFGALALAFIAAELLARRALVPIGEAFRRQQEFVADASHELRTPLTILRTALELLARSPNRGAAESASLVRDARAEVLHMEHVVADLLTLARSDLGALPLTLRPVDGAALMQEAAERVRAVAETKGITLTVLAPLPCRIEADSERIAQALLALTDNALQHTPSSGTVALSAYRDGDTVVLAVVDTGEGISAEDLARVTDRFYRAGHARARAAGGAGLGLAIVRAIVEAHGGTLHITSQPGAGTTVQLRLRGLRRQVAAAVNASA